MFKMSEASAIALHSMVYLSCRSNQFVSLHAISERFKISPNHLSKILQRLVKCGFITSSKGSSGGFKILPKKKNSSFLQVYYAIEGKQKLSNCIFQSRKINCHNCIMGCFVKNINRDFIQYLKKTKISDFSL